MVIILGKSVWCLSLGGPKEPRIRGVGLRWAWGFSSIEGSLRVFAMSPLSLNPRFRSST